MDSCCLSLGLPHRRGVGTSPAATILWRWVVHTSCCALQKAGAPSEPSCCSVPCYWVQVRLSKWLTELEQMFYGMSNSFDKVRSCGHEFGGLQHCCQA